MPRALVCATTDDLQQRFPDRKTFEHAVREALSLSASQAKRLAAGGWSALLQQPEEPDNETARVIDDALTQILKLEVSNGRRD